MRDEYKDMVGTGAALTGWVTLLSLVMCAALLVSLVFTRRFASGAFMVVGAFIVCVLMLVARMAIGELFW